MSLSTTEGRDTSLPPSSLTTVRPPLRATDRWTRMVAQNPELGLRHNIHSIRQKDRHAPVATAAACSFVAQLCTEPPQPPPPPPPSSAPLPAPDGPRHPSPVEAKTERTCHWGTVTIHPIPVRRAAVYPSSTIKARYRRPHIQTTAQVLGRMLTVAYPPQDKNVVVLVSRTSGPPQSVSVMSAVKSHPESHNNS